jgi:hypothetical protein
MYFLAIGHSHLDAVRNAYIGGGGSGRYSDLDIEFIDLHAFTPYEYYSANPEVIGPDLDDAIAAVLTRRGRPPAAVFLTVGGSDQHTVALLNHERPMEVTVPWAPDAPRNEAAHLIPFLMMEQLLRVEVDWKINLMSLIVKKLCIPSYFWQFPPPIGSEAHLRRFPGPQFEPLAETRGFSPLPFRMKIAAIHDRLFKLRCAELGVQFLPPPPAALEPNGSLSVDVSAEDSIHAGLPYGALLLDQVSAIALELAGADA